MLGVDATSPGFLATFMFAAFALAGGYTLFRRAAPMQFVDGYSRFVSLIACRGSSGFSSHSISQMGLSVHQATAAVKPFRP
jgi:hypothetical protein